MTDLQVRKMHRINRIHFVGIGGAGMSGIAEVLINRGYEVTGSDIKDGRITQSLRSSGVKVVIGHNANNVHGASVLVVSSAIADNNCELVAARELRIPIIARAEMLAELMRFHYGIAVSGSHGKTTVSSIVASVLEAAGLDPTLVVGGQLKCLSSHVRLGRSHYFVAEADESDASFLRLNPLVAVITNIDFDHMSTFEHSQKQLDNAFINYLHNLPFYGVAIVCGDDSGVQRIMPEISRFVLTYGFSEINDYRIVEYKHKDEKSYIRLSRPKPHSELDFVFPMAGRHNALNALAAVAVATYEGINDQIIKSSMTDFSGINRRMDFHLDIKINGHVCDLLDDYGHHPTEIDAVISTIRETWPERRLVMVFEPHRYTRTKDLFAEFVAVLGAVDQLIVTDVYPAGEAFICGSSATDLCHAIGRGSKSAIKPVYISDINAIPKTLSRICSNGDLIVLQGVSEISKVKDILLQMQ